MFEVFYVLLGAFSALLELHGFKRHFLAIDACQVNPIKHPYPTREGPRAQVYPGPC